MPMVIFTHLLHGVVLDLLDFEVPPASVAGNGEQNGERQGRADHQRGRLVPTRAGAQSRARELCREVVALELERLQLHVPACRYFNLLQLFIQVITTKYL